MYELVTGPLVWISFIIFIVGMTARVVSLIRLARKKDKVVFNHLSLKWSLRSILHWIIPYGSRAMREKPVFTFVTSVFHILLICTPIFLATHVAMVSASLNISWWTLPEKVTDYMTVVFVAAALFLLVRRITAPEVKILTTAYDYILIVAALAPFVTGFLAYHQLLNYDAMIILHALCGNIMLIVIPFTKLSHMVLMFLTRAHIGSEFGERRGAVTW